MKLKYLLLLAVTSSVVSNANAALTVTNGDFSDQSGINQAVTNWFESTTTGFQEYTATAGANGFQGTSGTVGAIESPAGYLYQSLGTVDAGSASFNVTGLAVGRNIRSYAAITFTFYTGAFATAADGTDIAGGGLTTLGTYVADSSVLTTMDFVGNGSGTQAFTSGEIDLTGSVGQTVWMRISSADAGTSNGGRTSQANPAFDSLVVTTTPVPEPSSTALLGLAGLGLLVRRNR